MVFRFRLTYPAKKEFSREYDVNAAQTLYDLHRFIQDDLEYDEAQPVIISTADAKWKTLRNFSLTGIKGTELMDQVTLDSIMPGECYHLLYTFDTISKRSFQLELCDMTEAQPRKRYPCLVFENGEAPSQIGKTNKNLLSAFDQALPDFGDDIYAVSESDE